MAHTLFVEFFISPGADTNRRSYFLLFMVCLFCLSAYASTSAGVSSDLHTVISRMKRMTKYPDASSSFYVLCRQYALLNGFLDLKAPLPCHVYFAVFPCIGHRSCKLQNTHSIGVLVYCGNPSNVNLNLLVIAALQSVIVFC